MTKDSENFDSKTLAKAAAEFNHKLAINLAELGASTAKDILSFSKVAVTCNTKLAEQFMPKGFGEDYFELISKFTRSLLQPSTAFEPFFKNFK